MKSFCNAFAVLMAALCTAGTANALPLTWRADWPDAKPVETLVHRGTDVELQPTWFINGQEANPSNWTFTTYCQTNAVGPWFGPLPGAFFSHTNDVGAAFYNVMVRAQMPGGGVNYTAFARFRMLDSPGYTPGELPLPVSTIDFSKVVAVNAPWLLPAATNDIATIKIELGSISNSVSTLSAATATNSAAIATLSAATAKNSAAIATLKDTTATLRDSISSAAGAATNYTDSTAATLRDSIATKQDSISDLATIREGAALGATALQSYTETDPVWTAEKGGYATTNALAAKADASSVYTKAQMDAALTGKLDKSGGEVTGSISMVNGALDAGDVQTRSMFDFLQPGQFVKSLDAPENSGKALTDADLQDSSSALGAALAGKQDTLPYATNAIPYAAISGKPTLAAVATSGSYNDLLNRPTIPTVPTNVSAFNNDAGYISSYTESDPVWTAEKGGYATTNALALKADDADVVHRTGDETMTGDLTINKASPRLLLTNGANDLALKIINGNKYIATEDYDYQLPHGDGTFALTAGTGHTGNLAALDARGNPVDSGKSAADFATAGELAAAAGAATNYTDLALGAALAGKQDILPYATNAIPYAAITGKPTFATVATSGSYNDLTDKPTIPSPTAPVASATLAWQSNGSAIVVSVGAAETLSTTLTGWVDGQTQTALITIAAGASVSSEVKLVGYGTWPTSGQFLASATRVGMFVYVTPIVLVN